MHLVNHPHYLSPTSTEAVCPPAVRASRVQEGADEGRGLHLRPVHTQEGGVPLRGLLPSHPSYLLHKETTRGTV